MIEELLSIGQGRQSSSHTSAYWVNSQRELRWWALLATRTDGENGADGEKKPRQQGNISDSLSKDINTLIFGSSRTI